jgi:hypothetical protein
MIVHDSEYYVIPGVLFANYEFNYKELSRYVVMYPTNLGITRCPPPILAVVG